MEYALTVAIRLEEEENELFAASIRNLVEAGALPSATEVSIQSQRPGVGGFALSIPSEVVVALLTAVATTTTTEILKTIWSELRDFIKSRRNIASNPNKTLKLTLNGKILRLSLSALEGGLPKELEVEVLNPDKPRGEAS